VVVDAKGPDKSTVTVEHSRLPDAPTRRVPQDLLAPSPRHAQDLPRRERCVMGAPHELRILLDGLAFVETPRWHDGRLWFARLTGPDQLAPGRPMPPRAEAGWCRVGCRVPVRSWCRVGYRVPVRGWGRLVPALVVWCPSAGSRSFPRERSSPPPGRGASLRVGSAGPLGLSRQGAAALSPSGCPLDPPGARFVPTPLLSLLPRTHARQQRQKVGDGATVTRKGGPLPRRRGGGNSRPLRCAIASTHLNCQRRRQ
jgi:hypothetical protein